MDTILIPGEGESWQTWGMAARLLAGHTRLLRKSHRASDLLCVSGPVCVCLKQKERMKHCLCGELLATSSYRHHL